MPRWSSWEDPCCRKVRQEWEQRGEEQGTRGYVGGERERERERRGEGPKTIECDREKQDRKRVCTRSPRLCQENIREDPTQYSPYRRAGEVL